MSLGISLQPTTYMAAKKTVEETAETTEQVTVSDVISAPVAEDVNVPARGDLEKEGRVETVAAERRDPEMKLVNHSNNTQSFTESEIQKVTHPEIVQGAPSMDNADVSKLVTIDNIETPVVQREMRVIDSRLKKADFKRIMDDMKVSNPTKFQNEQADLQRQMDAAPE